MAVKLQAFRVNQLFVKASRTPNDQIFPVLVSGMPTEPDDLTSFRTEYSIGFPGSPNPIANTKFRFAASDGDNRLRAKEWQNAQS
jgi:hypothetical protein